MADWSEWPLAEIIDFQEGPGILAKDFRAQGVPLVRLSGLGPHGSVLDGCDYLDPEAVSNRWSHFALRAGDVLLSSSASLGRIAVVGADAIGAIPYTGIIRMRPRDERLIAPFIRYLLQGPEFQRQAEVAGVGSVMRHFGPMHLRRMSLTIPGTSVQRRIVGILGALDDKIELNRALSETLEGMARGLFKSWFIDFDPVQAKVEGRDTGLTARLASLFPARLADSELGEIPDGWVIGTLSDVAENPRRGVHPRGIPPETPYIALEHMPRRSIGLSDWGTAEGLESNKSAFTRGDILFGKLRPYFHKVGVAPVDGVCSTDILVVSPASDRWFGFVLGQVSSSKFVEYTNAGSTGTRMPRTSWTQMATYKCVIPPDGLAEAFTALLRPLVDRLIAGIHESRSLTALRDSLLPRLVSGDLHIDDPDRSSAGGE